MSTKKGEIYFKDYHGNFHKLDVNELDEDFKELTTYDNKLSLRSVNNGLCKYKPLKYYELELDDDLNLENSLYKFSVYLTISTNKYQRIYFFLRNDKIIATSLQTQVVFDKIPNNLNFNFIVNNVSNTNCKFAIISDEDLSEINFHVLYTKIN